MVIFFSVIDPPLAPAHPDTKMMMDYLYLLVIDCRKTRCEWSERDWKIHLNLQMDISNRGVWERRCDNLLSHRMSAVEARKAESWMTRSVLRRALVKDAFPS